MFEESQKKLEELKVVPVVKLNKEEDAIPLGEALCAAGLPIAEVTFRTEAAEEAIRKMVGKFPQMTVGAGTVVNVEQAKQAVDAGAQFLVSPGFNRKVVEFAIDKNVPVYPGVCTPTEILMGLEYGLSVLKFFPASLYGGVKGLQSLGAVFSQIRFMPTGGINLTNLQEYLSCPSVIACGGSWMVKESYIRDGQFDTIKNLTEEAVRLAKEK